MNKNRETKTKLANEEEECVFWDGVIYSVLVKEKTKINLLYSMLYSTTIYSLHIPSAESAQVSSFPGSQTTFTLRQTTILQSISSRLLRK